MEDEFFGHRDPFSGEPVGDKDEWLPEDFALAKAAQAIETYTDSNGLRQWQKEDPLKVIDAERKIDPFRAAVERRTSGKKYKAAPGEYWVPVVGAERPGNKPWSYQEWVESIHAKIEEENPPDN